MQGVENSLPANSNVHVEVFAPDSKTLANELRSFEPEPGETISEFRSRYKRLGPIIDPIEFQKNWQTGQAAAVSRCDVIIIAGGREGAATILALANAMNKPVIGIPQFGGVGREYFQSINKIQLMQSGFAAEGFKAIEYWQADSAETYVLFAEKQWRRERKNLQPAYAGIGLFIIVLCAVWVLCFKSGLNGEHWLRLLPMACCSGLLGWSLSFANNLEAYSAPVYEASKAPPGERAFREIVIVSLLALAYGFLGCEASALYGISVETLDAAKIRTLATGISVIGFAVGALSSEAYTKLQSKLSEKGLG